MSEPDTFHLRVRCENLPGVRFGDYAAVRLGIQTGQEVVEDVPADAEEAVFTVPLSVKRHVKEGHPVFTGPFVHGTSREPFLYLSWGERNDGEWEMFRRAKLPLKSLSWDRIMKAVDTGQPVEVVVETTDRKGGPVSGGLNESNMRWAG